MPRLWSSTPETAHQDYDTFNSWVYIPDESRVRLMVQHSNVRHWFNEYDRLSDKLRSAEDLDNVVEVTKRAFFKYRQHFPSDHLLPIPQLAYEKASFFWNHKELEDGQILLAYIDRGTSNVVVTGEQGGNKPPFACIIDPAKQHQRTEIWMPEQPVPEITLVVDALAAILRES
jgi:hypothetical protein